MTINTHEKRRLGNFGAFKAVAIGAGAARLSSDLATAYHDATATENANTGMTMGLKEAVRLAARVLDKERKRELAAQDRSTAGGGNRGSRGRSPKQ